MPCTTDNVPNSSKNPNQASIRYPDTVIYTCAAGYQLSDGSSSVTRSCGTDGSLSGTTPACSGKFHFSLYFSARYKLSDDAASLTRYCATDRDLCLCGASQVCSSKILILLYINDTKVRGLLWLLQLATNLRSLYCCTEK